MSDCTTIAESKHFIVLDQYTPDWEAAETYQGDSELEHELIQDLQNQGHEYLPGLNVPQGLNAEAAWRCSTTPFKREFASENGTGLNAVLPKMSPLNPQFKAKMQAVSEDRRVS